MPRYVLSNGAKNDLLAIARYGDKTYGLARSDAHRDTLIKHFELLAETPLIFQAVDHIRPGYRRSVCQNQVIYYRIKPFGEEIMRVLGRQYFGDH